MVRDWGNAVLLSASRWEMAERESVGPLPVRGQLILMLEGKRRTQAQLTFGGKTNKMGM